jgi:D-arabinose 1-dehydrogenase-like Zn-dependent alcohol dehydrogenase
MKQWKITQEGFVVSKALIGVLLGEMIPGKWRRGRAVVVGTMATSHRSLAYVERVVDKLCQRMKRAGYIEHEGQGVWRWRTDVDAKATALELLDNYDETGRPRL